MKLLMMILCLSIAGCATAPKIEKPFVDPEYGMTKKQLVDLIGDPDSIEMYQKPDKTRIEFDNYFKKYASTQEKVPVCLVNNKVVGWGKTFYEDHVSLDDTRIK